MSSSLSALRAKIFRADVFSDEDVYRYMVEIDQTLNRAVDVYLRHTEWPLIYLSVYVNRILFTTLRNQKVLTTTLPRSKRAADPRREGVSNQKATDLFSDDEIVFLNTINRLVMYHCKKGPLPSVDDLCLFRRTRVEMTEAFLSLAERYYSACNRYAKAYQAYQHNPALTSDPRYREDLREIQAIESVLGPNLIGTYLGTKRHFSQMVRLRNIIAEPFMRKVWTTVMAYVSQTDDRFLALTSIGMMGLITGVNCFEHDRKSSLGTFAEFWIRQHILEYMKDKLNLIAQSNKDIQCRTRIRTALRDMNWGTEPVDRQVELLSQHLSLKRCEVVKYLQDNIALSGAVSIHAQYGDDGKSTIGDIIPDTTQIEDLVEEADEIQHLLQVIQGMNEERQKAIRAYFVLNANESMLSARRTPQLTNLIRQAYFARLHRECLI